MATDVELKRAGLNAEYRALVERVMPEGMWNWCERHASELTRLLDASRPSPTQDQREAVARLAALHGIGRIDGMGNREPPNEKWTQGEWERRILDCVPRAVELQCYALADAILALVNAEALRPLAARAEAAEARASSLTARLEALVGACKPFVEAAEPIEHDTGGRWNPDTWFKRTKALTVGDFRALKAAHDAALNGGAGSPE